MSSSSRTTTAARRLAAADPAGMIYGAIVSAAAMATVSLHTDEAQRVAIGTGVVLAIYWLADLYVHALSVRFDGDSRGLVRRLSHAAGHKASVLKGGVPTIASYLVTYVLVRDVSVAAYTALGVTIVLLTIAGYLGARQAGSPERAAVVEGLGAGLLGVLVVVAKSLLH